ncbi:MAG: ATP-binding protein [Lautropia sp.]|nr:ATP-binding protein [Lautropia sp.]
MDEFFDDFRAAECQKHGAYMSRRIQFPFAHKPVIWTMCKECLRQAGEDARAAENRHRAIIRQARFRRMFGDDLVPARYRGKGFDDYVCEHEAQRKALRQVRSFADRVLTGEEGDDLILMGATGTGKTHLACAVVQALCDEGRVVVRVDAPRLVHLIHESWRPDARFSTQDIVAALEASDLLVIDDVSSEWATEGIRVILGEMLKRRYERRAPTLLVAIENIRGVQAFIGDRALARAKESVRVVIFDWESHRGRLTNAP